MRPDASEVIRFAERPPRALSSARCRARIAATTIQAIATESGVAVPTIYDAFGSKRGLLEAARLVMLRDSRIPELMAEAIGEPDPGRKLDLAARWLRLQMESSYDVIRAFREASRADPDAAADHRRILDRRARSLEGFVASVRPHLAQDVSVRTANDVLWAFSNEELYRELVAERGWSHDRYERWLARTLRAQLLGEQSQGHLTRQRNMTA